MTTLQMLSQLSISMNHLHPQLSTFYENLKNQTITLGVTQFSQKPKWLTPEIITGGFPTGRYLALLITGETNETYMTEDGMNVLLKMYDSGEYTITHVENTALMTVAVLLRNNNVQDAMTILQHIQPYFSTIRFFPKESSVISTEPLIFLEPVSKIKSMFDTLLSSFTNIEIPRIRRRICHSNTMLKFKPLVLSTIELFDTTFVCECHKTQSSCDNDECGWPCQVFSHDWSRLIVGIHAKFENLYRQYNNKLNFRFFKQGSLFMKLRDIVNVCSSNTLLLHGTHVGFIRSICISYHKKHAGIKLTEYRQYLESYVVDMSHQENIQTIIKRLGVLPPHDGIHDMTSIVTGLQLDKSIIEKVNKGLVDTLHNLLEKQIISSGEILGTIIPKLIAVSTCGNVDIEKKRLYIATKSAFNTRRSLMLIPQNGVFEHQFRIDEIPWFSHITIPTNNTRDVLAIMVKANFDYFPETIVPNKLLEQFKTLIVENHLLNSNVLTTFHIPTTAELASDIFQSFSKSFAISVHYASLVMKNTLYATYYNLDTIYAEMESWVFTQQRGIIQLTNNRISLDTICRNMIGTIPTSYVVKNGMMIESCQILSTHNLAQLLCNLNILPTLSIDKIIVKIWTYILSIRRTDEYKTNLQNIKNVAYAWRQLIFFLSFEKNKNETVATMCRMLSDMNDDRKTYPNEQRYQALFSHFMIPLFSALNGISPTTYIRGWTVSCGYTHWLFT